MCQPDNGEMALDVVDQLVRSNAVDIIVVDSVAALVPKVELGESSSSSSVLPGTQLLIAFVLQRARWATCKWVCKRG